MAWLLNFLHPVNFWLSVRWEDTRNIPQRVVDTKPIVLRLCSWLIGLKLRDVGHITWRLKC